MEVKQHVNRLTCCFSVVAAAIKRTVIMPPLLASADYTWNLSQQFIWSFVEVNGGLVCASLAALNPLFTRYIPYIVSRLRPWQDHRRPSSEPGAADKNAGGSDPSALCSQAYGLPSQRPGADDDEAQLWSCRHLCLGKAVSSRDSVRGQRHRDSLDSLGLADLYPGARPPISSISAGGCGMHASQSTEGIKVTKETFVSYEK